MRNPRCRRRNRRIRFWKTSEFERIEQALFDMQKRPFIPAITVSLKRQSFRPAMEVSAKTEAVMKIVEAAGQAIDLPVEWRAVGGGSDASITANLGVPSLDAFGPIGGNYHEDNEFLSLDSVIPRIEFVKNVLRRL
jgi:glutamate carboxypeptidase